VSIPGGEPRAFADPDRSCEAWWRAKKYLYLLHQRAVAEKLHLFKPGKIIGVFVHVDGQRRPPRFFGLPLEVDTIWPSKVCARR